MLNLPIISFETKTFLSFEDQFNFRKIQKKITREKIKSIDISQLEEIGLSPYKLEIRIDPFQIYGRFSILKEMILMHLRKEAFFRFAYIKHSTKSFEKLSHFINSNNFLTHFVNNCKEEKAIPKLALIKLRAVLNALIGEGSERVLENPIHELPKVLAILSNAIVVLKEQLATQFMVYLPVNFDKNKIVAFCNDLNTYLKNLNVPLGYISPASLRMILGSYIVFKDQWNRDDFELLNETFNLDIQKITSENLNKPHSIDKNALEHYKELHKGFKKSIELSNNYMSNVTFFSLEPGIDSTDLPGEDGLIFNLI